jgi:hypothetical protein
MDLATISMDLPNSQKRLLPDDQVVPAGIDPFHVPTAGIQVCSRGPEDRPHGQREQNEHIH